MIRALTLILFCTSSFIKAQDVHFSQFEKTKSLLNPSLISHQKDDYQLQLQRRSQWSSVTVPFNSFAISLAAKEIYKDFSLSTTLLNDVAGDSQFSTEGLNVSIAKSLYKKDNYFSIGLIFGVYQRSVDFSGLVFLDPEKKGEVAFNFLDIGVGFSYIRMFKNNNSFIFGLSSYHLNKPNQSLNSTERVVLNQKHIAHTAYSSKINSKIVLRTVFYTSAQKNDMETIIGSGMIYKIDNKLGLKTGIYSRFNDAFFMTFGVDADDFEAIISYDLNTSSLAKASRNMGGLEFSIAYRWNILKETEEVKEKICPKYL